MVILSEYTVKCSLDLPTLVSHVEQAFKNWSASVLVMPKRLHIELSSKDILLIMPCYSTILNTLGIKVVVIHKGEGSGGRLEATYFVIDIDTGKVSAVLGANYLTDVRTAATSAVATQFLAASGFSTLGIFGTGRQAHAHLVVFRSVFGNLRKFFVCGSQRAKTEQFAARMAAEEGLHVEPAESRKCVEQSDVICTCTNSDKPVFKGRWLRDGTHLNVVGSFQPGAREVDDAAVRSARVVVDTYDGAFAEAGDLLIPLRHGSINREHILAELHEVVSGKTQPRRSPSDITMFKSVGCALEDLVAAQLVYEHCRGTE